MVTVLSLALLFSVVMFVIAGMLVLVDWLWIRERGH